MIYFLLAQEIRRMGNLLLERKLGNEKLWLLSQKSK
jgi:hypothetical protein